MLPSPSSFQQPEFRIQEIDVKPSGAESMTRIATLVGGIGYDVLDEVSVTKSVDFFAKSVLIPRSLS